MSHDAAQQRAAAKCILLVEDDPAILDMLTQLLELEGYRVRQATTGPAALDILARATSATPPEPCATAIPDLVVLDLLIPGLQGDEVIRRAAEGGRAVPPVIVVSAKPAAAVEQAAHRIHAAGTLLKPFNIDALLATIDAALKQAPAPQWRAAEA